MARKTKQEQGQESAQEAKQVAKREQVAHEIIEASKHKPRVDQGKGVPAGLSMNGYAERCVEEELDRMGSRLKMFLFVAKQWPHDFKDFTAAYRRAWLAKLGVGQYVEGEFQTLEAAKWPDAASLIWRTAGLPSVNVCKAVMYAFEVDLTGSVKRLEGPGTFQQKLKDLPKKRPTARTPTQKQAPAAADQVIAANPEAVLMFLRSAPFALIPGLLLSAAIRGQAVGEADPLLSDVCRKCAELVSAMIEHKQAKAKGEEQTAVKAAELLFGQHAAPAVEAKAA